jgi:transcriptional regulator with XRE-family HTH domain
MARTPWYHRGEQRRRRIAAGLDQRDLAGMTNLSHQTIGNIETGRRQPSPAAAGRIATALGCRIEDLMHLGQSAEPGAA